MKGTSLLNDWPYLVSTKLDGIRCILINGRALTASLKPIPNRHIRKVLEGMAAEYPEYIFDGEIVHPQGTFQDTVSRVMSHEGEPKFTYCIFDCVRHNNFRQCAEDRYNELLLMGLNVDYAYCIDIIYQAIISGWGELVARIQDAFDADLEGLMLRSCASPYKLGRASANEGHLHKIKFLHDSIGIVRGVEELMENGNPPVKNERGLTERSSSKQFLIPTGMMGSILTEDAETGQKFKVGTGWAESERIKIWRNYAQYLGKKFEYTYQRVGIKDAPRQPVFKGWI